MDRISNESHQHASNLISTVSATNNAPNPERPPTPKPHGPALITLGRGENLQEHLNGPHRRVIVDFYADWCGPCRRQGKVLHEFESTALEAGALIVKVDVEQHKSLARSLAVQSLPTLLVYDNGQLLQRRTGLTDAKQLLAWVQLETNEPQQRLAQDATIPTSLQ